MSTSPVTSEPPPDPARGRPGRARRLLRLLVWAAVAVASLCLLLAWVLRTDWIREVVRVRVVETLETSLARDVEIDALDFSVVPVTASATGITIGGPEGLGEPLATVGRLTVRVGPSLVRSLWSDEPLVLSEIVVIEPMLHVVFDESGASNLPDLPESPDDGRGLEVRVEALHVERGVAHLEQHSLLLDLVASGFAASLREVDEARLLARADAERLEVRYLDGLPISGSLSAQAVVGEGAVEIQRVALRSEQLRAEAHGGYRNEVLRLEISAEGDLGLLVEAGLLEQASGAVEVDGVAEAGAESWSVEARLSSPGLAVGDLAIDRVEGRVTASPEAFRVEVVRLEMARGVLRGALASVDGRDGEIVADVSLESLDLAELLRSLEAPVAGLEGRLEGEGRYRFTAAAPLDGRGEGMVRVTPNASASSGAPAPGLPVTAALPFELVDGRLSVSDGRISAPDQEIRVDGAVELAAGAAEFRLALETSDPRALLRILPAVYENDPSPLWEPAQGRGTVDVRLAVDPSGFRSLVELDLRAVEVSGSHAARASGSLEVDDAGIQRLDLELVRGVASLGLHASIPFEGAGAEGATPPFGVDLEIDRWAIGDAAPWLPLELPFDGVLTGSLRLAGELEALRGRLEASVEELSVAGVPVEATLGGELVFTPEAVDLGPLRLSLPAGEVELVGRIETATEALDLRLTSSPIDLSSPPFDDWTTGFIAGVAEIDATVGGTLSAPEARAGLLGSGLAMEGRALGGDGSARAELEWRDGEVRVRGSLLGLLEIDGGGRLDASSTEIRVDLVSPELDEVVRLALGQAPDDLAGRLAGVLEVRGTGGVTDVRVELDELWLSHLGRTISAVEPVVLSFGADGPRVESFWLREEGSGSDLVVHGSLGSPASGLDLAIASTIDAAWLNLYLPDLEISGGLEFLAVVGGTPSRPEIDGQGRLFDGRLILADFPHAVEEMEGLLFFDPDRIVIDSGRARFAGGSVSAEGAFAPADDATWGYELRLKGTGLDLRYPEDWRIQGDALLTLASSGEGRVLGGTVSLERAAFIRDFQLGFTQLLRSMFQRRPELVEETDEVLLETRLNIAVEGPDALVIRTNLASLRGDLDFSVRGNLAAPVLLGDIVLQRGGEVSLGSSEYMLERGVLTFANPFRNDPRVDIVAAAQIRSYDVRLNLFGPLDDLETSLSSTPPLPDLDIVSLLATGSADMLGDFGTGTPTETDTLAAEGFLAGQAVSFAGRRVGTLLGLDQVQISPLTGGSTDLSAARITVGKRISRDVYVTYSYDPSESEEDIFELTWQMYPSIAVILTRTDDGSIAVDLRWDTTF